LRILNRFLSFFQRFYFLFAKCSRSGFKHNRYTIVDWIGNARLFAPEFFSNLNEFALCYRANQYIHNSAIKFQRYFPSLLLEMVVNNKTVKIS